MGKKDGINHRGTNRRKEQQAISGHAKYRKEKEKKALLHYAKKKPVVEKLTRTFEPRGMREDSLYQRIKSRVLGRKPNVPVETKTTEPTTEPGSDKLDTAAPAN